MYEAMNLKRATLYAWIVFMRRNNIIMAIILWIPIAWVWSVCLSLVIAHWFSEKKNFLYPYHACDQNVSVNWQPLAVRFAAFSFTFKNNKVSIIDGIFEHLKKWDSLWNHLLLTKRTKVSFTVSRRKNEIIQENSWENVACVKTWQIVGFSCAPEVSTWLEQKEWSLCHETLKIAGKTLVNIKDTRPQGRRKVRKRGSLKRKMCGNEGIWGFYWSEARGYQKSRDVDNEGLCGQEQRD